MLQNKLENRPLKEWVPKIIRTQNETIFRFHSETIKRQVRIIPVNRKHNSRYPSSLLNGSSPLSLQSDFFPSCHTEKQEREIISPNALMKKISKICYNEGKYPKYFLCTKNGGI